MSCVERHGLSEQQAGKKGQDYPVHGFVIA